MQIRRNRHEEVHVVVVCLVLAGPAVAETVGEKLGVNSLLGRSPTTQDFITEAAISDMFEIQSSKLAQEKKDAKEMSSRKR